MESKSSRHDDHSSHKSGGHSDQHDPQSKSTYMAESKDVVVSKLTRSASSRARGDSSDAKTRDLELEQDMEADEEFERMKLAPVVVVPAVAPTQVAKNFVNGFKIISMNMKDANTGEEIWRSSHWDAVTMFDEEIQERISKYILSCRTVSRELIFSSSEEIKKFRLEQRVYFRGTCIEEWFFTFGFVMPHSQNSWQQTIDAAPPAEMLPSEVLSGNVIFETSFFDDKTFLCKNSVRIFYV